MGLYSYARLARARWVLVVAGMLVGLAVASALVLVQPERYSSEATIVVSPIAAGTASEIYDAQVMAAEKARSYTSALTGELLAREVVADLGLPLDPARLAQDITVTLSPETPVVVVGATADDPQTAQRIVTAVAERYRRTVESLETVAAPGPVPVLTVRTLGAATLDTEPVSPRIGRDVGLGGLLGLAAGLALAVLLERRRRPVRAAEDVAGIAPVLGTLPAEATAARLLAPGADGPVLHEARRIRSRLSGRHGADRGRAIAVVSPSAGDGRSTVAAALATAWARTGDRVLLVDADRHRPFVSEYVGAGSGAAGFLDVAAGDVTLEQASWTVPGTGLPVLGVGRRADGPADLLGSSAARVLVRELAGRNDVVVIDTPASGVSGDGLDLARCCDAVVLVARRDRTSLHELRALRAAMDEIGVSCAGLVLTSGARRDTRVPQRATRTGSDAAPADPQVVDGARDRQADLRALRAERTAT